MERRTAIQRLAAALAAILIPLRLKAADNIDAWSRTPGAVPVYPVSGTVPAAAPQTAVKKALQWASMCLRQGNHWTFEGIGWLVATLPFMRNHLCNVHGHKHYEVDGLDRAQLVAWHDAHHNGTPIAGFSIPPTPANGVNRMPQYIMDTLPQQNCPGGHCPIPQRHRRG